MDKVIHSGSFDIKDPPVILMDVHRRGVDRSWMQKRAAVLTSEMQDIKPTPGYSYVHLIALGDTEVTGPNRNADGFSKSANQKKHHTFVDHGHVYKHHKNTDPKYSTGKVAASAHNDNMGRVELVVGLKEKDWDKELQKLAEGKDIPFSMGCHVDHDVCIICDNKAKNRSYYCEHMKKHAGQILSDGRRVYVDNPDPDFFDISGVVRPADQIAYSLQKVASSGVITGADLAIYEGLEFPTDVGGSLSRIEATRPKTAEYMSKLSILRKLSEIEKEIEMVAPGCGINSLAAGFDPEVNCSGLEEGEVDKLTDVAQSNISELMSALDKVQITLPLDLFIKLITGEKADAELKGQVENKLPGIFSRMLETCPNDIAEDGMYDPCITGSPLTGGSMKGIIDKMVPGLSLDPEMTGNRAMVIISRKSSPEMLTGADTMNSIKLSHELSAAEILAREYTRYKVAALLDMSKRGASATTLKLGVLQHYVSS